MPGETAIPRLSRQGAHLLDRRRDRLLLGWRQSTIDIDLRFEPEVDELLRELSSLKERLEVNIELVSPPDFIPALPGWRERSPLAFRTGNVDIHHFDPYFTGALEDRARFHP